MNKIHEKSPCCNVSIRRFGERRRQCALCHKTWRVWKRRKGRKRKRMSDSSLFKYLKGGAIYTKLNKKTYSARLRCMLRDFNKKTQWIDAPNGALIVVADAIIDFFKGKPYTVYFILVRGILSSEACILPPYMRAGPETAQGWEEAFDRIPQDIFKRICALVCDGHPGLVTLTRTFRWLLQRCHFHLLASLSHRISFRPKGKTSEMGLKIKKLVQIVLYQKNNSIIVSALRELDEIKNQVRSRHLKSVLSGFLKHYEDFRTYIKFPEYFLPNTTNSAEFFNSRIRDLQYRARGFRTPSSFFMWVVGLCKYQKKITCRHKNQPN